MTKDPTEIAANADGSTVSADRLDRPVVSALDDGEQPHHLLRGESLEETAADSASAGRLFPRVNDTVSVAATGRRVLIVVPQSATTETRTVAYDEITDVGVDTERFPELHIETPSQSVVINISGNESPDPLVSYIDEQRTDDTVPVQDEPESDDGSVDVAGTPSDSEADPLEQIERLASLNEQGIITEEEFRQKKQQLLDQL